MCNLVRRGIFWFIGAGLILGTTTGTSAQGDAAVPTPALVAPRPPAGFISENAVRSHGSFIQKLNIKFARFNAFRPKNGP